MENDKYERVARRIVTSGTGWTVSIQGQDVTEFAIRQIAEVLRQEFGPEITVTGYGDKNLR